MMGIVILVSLRQHSQMTKVSLNILLRSFWKEREREYFVWFFLVGTSDADNQKKKKNGGGVGGGGAGRRRRKEF